MEVVVISARIEEEIAMLDEEERTAFLEDLGLDQSGLDKMIQACYKLLGQISFLTSGPDECRAWTIKKGTKAPAGRRQDPLDFERGFIRAEVVAFDDLMACKTYAAAREKGLVRSEGKDYVMKDGDIVLFRFNVYKRIKRIKRIRGAAHKHRFVIRYRILIYRLYDLRKEYFLPQIFLQCKQSFRKRRQRFRIQTPRRAI